MSDYGAVENDVSDDDPASQRPQVSRSTGRDEEGEVMDSRSEPTNSEAGGKPATADVEPSTTSESSDGGDDSSPALQRSDLPLKLRRDGVKEFRKNLPVPVLDETKNQIRDVQHEMGKRFDEDVYKLDVYEAIMRAGIQELDLVEEELRNWGYDFE